MGRWYPRLDQLGGIGAALVAQRVEARGDEQGRRQALGRNVDRRRAIIGGVGGILVAEPFHPALGQQIAFLEIAIDRKSVVSGKSVSVRVDLGGRRNIKKKIKK